MRLKPLNVLPAGAVVTDEVTVIAGGRRINGRVAHLGGRVFVRGGMVIQDHRDLIAEADWYEVIDVSSEQ